MTRYALGNVSPLLPPDGSCWIAPGAHVVGDVRLGRDVGIWFGAVLRGDNEPINLGDGTNIQEHAIVHTDLGYPAMIGAHVTIGHRAMIHGCAIGDGSLVGMGAIVLNGAHIGKNCLIGAGALITEGKEIPDGSLVMGAPAKVVRELDGATIESLHKSADNYVENWKRFAVNLKELDGPSNCARPE